jgi:2-polyprenyl-6-methoxyphenol hydroxylase-like FAD-dependent oxidoreductase
VTPRTLEVWDDMGIAREMIGADLWFEGMRSILAGHPPHDELIDLSELPYGHLGLPQYETERLLASHLAFFGIAVERGTALSELRQDDNRVIVTLDNSSGGEPACFDYVVGCDGAHSMVRNLLGISFDGEAFPMDFMLGDVAIAWDLPRGMALRALRLNADAAPDMFIAIPLPERNRYRVSMLAPRGLAHPGIGTEHLIQSEHPVPSLDHLQAVADALVPDKPRVSDPRWSSVFRISMRLAGNYRKGRCLIAGDAVHIHPPTGGQGMNTGIQDAYNLAWKLALVMRGEANPALLDSYEAERRLVGAETLARTRKASLRFGREPGSRDRLADTQIRVNYRGTDWVADELANDAGLRAGDRAPDCTGLRQPHLGFPLRMFDVLRGTQHVLLAPLAATPSSEEIARLAELGPAHAGHLRVAAIGRQGPVAPEIPGVQVLTDAEGSFAAGYGASSIFLVRPDRYIGWAGSSCTNPGLAAYLERMFKAAPKTRV